MTLSTERLLAVQAPHCVTLCQPLRPSDPDRNRVRLELRHAMEAAAQGLTERGVDEETRAAMLAEVTKLQADTEAVPRSGETLFALLTPENQEIHVLDHALPARVTVADRFALTDLIAAEKRNPPFYVLTLADDGVRFMRVTGPRVTTVKLPLERKDRAAANAERTSPVPGGALHANTSGGRGNAPTLHKQGFGHEDRDADERAAWYHFVIKALDTYFARKDTPLVLVADVVHQGPFRKQCQLANLLPDGVEANPADMTDEQVVERARAVAPAPSVDVDDALSTAKSKATDSAEVLRSAQMGQVDTLFFAPDERRDDVVDVAVRETLANGGAVVPVELTDLPDGPVAATLRWSE